LALLVAYFLSEFELAVSYQRIVKHKSWSQSQSTDQSRFEHLQHHWHRHITCHTFVCFTTSCSSCIG
jgi:hypothetical protein